MGRIVIVGAGIGGLAFAYLYKGDAELILFEKRPREALGFPWHDSVRLDKFEETGVPLPTTGVCGKKPFDMYSPHAEGYFPQRKKTVSSGAEIDRVALISHLISLVENKVTMRFQTEVCALEVEEGVKGVVLDSGERIPCDLVLDACGGFSPLRRYVCDKADAEPNADEILYASRAMYEIPKGTYVADRDAVYIKHLGVNGVAWCRTAPEKECMDVFVSALGTPLTKEMIAHAEQDMRGRNSAFCGKERERTNAKLVLRYPLSQLVYNGYAAVGDSAYSANPVNGCGIENALRSGAMLAETVSKAEGYTTQQLWEYQVRFMRSIGSSMLMLDVLKRWIFTVDAKDIDWLFSSVLGEEIIETLTDESGKKSFNASLFLGKVPVAWNRKDLLSEAINALSTAAAAKAFAAMVPPVYEKKMVSLWRKKYDGYIKERKYLKG